MTFLKFCRLDRCFDVLTIKNIFEPNIEANVPLGFGGGGLWRARPPTGGLLNSAPKDGHAEPVNRQSDFSFISYEYTAPTQPFERPNTGQTYLQTPKTWLVVRTRVIIFLCVTIKVHKLFTSFFFPVKKSVLVQFPRQLNFSRAAVFWGVRRHSGRSHQFLETGRLTPQKNATNINLQRSKVVLFHNRHELHFTVFAAATWGSQRRQL